MDRHKKHPAKFSDNILDVIKEYVRPEWIILDPMSGTGKLNKIINNNNLVLNEIEYEWAMQGKPSQIINGNALYLPFKDKSFDCIITSCTYGNRLADHHVAKDGSKRISYFHNLGKILHRDNSGQMQYGNQYKTFHKVAWEESNRVLRNNGIFILNVSNHIRNKKEVYVSEWHLDFIKNLGYSLIEHKKINTHRLKYGSNSDQRVEHENLFIMKKL
jgi:tRNA G10  N-methylase Trm11